jgi:ornithine decarboxylase
MEPPPLEDYFAVIHRAFEACRFPTRPSCGASRAGRCAPNTSSLIVKVEKRRGDELYINDGAYGALFDAAHVGWRFPVRCREDVQRQARWRSLLRPDLRRCRPHGGPVHAAGRHPGRRLYRDRHARRLWRAMKTGFNGFGVEDRVIVDDEPMASLYYDVAERKRATNVITL